LPSLTRHEPLSWPLSELADEASPERPVAGLADHTHESLVPLRGAGKCSDVVVHDRCSVSWTCRKLQLVDTRLKPAAHSNAKGLLP